MAGGKGERSGFSAPKQYLKFDGKELIVFTLEIFQRNDLIDEIVIPAEPVYFDLLNKLKKDYNLTKISEIVEGGKERQDSVYSGLQEIDVNSELVCIHDSARPLVNTEDVEKVLKDGSAVGAAVLGVPAKATIKEVNSDSLVVKTLDRKTLWEMQTPQVLK